MGDCLMHGCQTGHSTNSTDERQPVLTQAHHCQPICLKRSMLSKIVTRGGRKVRRGVEVLYWDILYTCWQAGQHDAHDRYLWNSHLPVTDRRSAHTSHLVMPKGPLSSIWRGERLKNSQTKRLRATLPLLGTWLWWWGMVRSSENQNYTEQHWALRYWEM